MAEYVLLEYYLARLKLGDKNIEPIIDRILILTTKLYTFINGEEEEDWTIYHVGHFIHKVTNSISQINIGAKDQWVS